MKNARILIVEDERIIAEEIKNILTDLGYTVAGIVDTGEKAIEMVKKDTIHLILMDIMLKGDMDGIETSNTIKSISDIPIIYVTAYAEEKQLERAKITEPFAYLIKPVHSKELYFSIEMALYKFEMEKKLRENEKKYRTMFNNANDAMLLHGINKDGLPDKFVEVNDIASKLYGYSKETLLQMTPFDLNNNKNGIQEVMHTLQTKGKHTFETIGISKDGKKIPVEISSHLFQLFNQDRILSIVRDISIRKEAEKKLQHAHDVLEKRVLKRTQQLQELTNEHMKTRDYLRNIINSASEVIIAIDNDKKITTWNKKAEQLTGFKESSVVGKSIKYVDFFADLEELEESIEKVYDGKPPISNIVLLNKKNKPKKCIIQSSFSLVLDAEKNPIGLLLVGRDITHEIGSHGKVVQGHCYLISESEKQKSLNLFQQLADIDCPGLYITRDNPYEMKDKMQLKNVETRLLHHHPITGFEVIKDLKDLEASVELFSKKHEKSIIFLDRFDYLLVQFSFTDVMKMIYRLSFIVAEHNAILLLYLNPSYVDDEHVSLLQSELISLQNQQIDNIQIDPDYYKILSIIDKYNKNNMLVNINSLSRELSLNQKTVSKKMKDLENKQLIVIRKKGRIKTSHITEKGQILLDKRDIA